MRSPTQTAFAAVFQTEVLLNSKRIAPYALMTLFTVHAVLWWGWSAGATFGWAANGDFNLVRNFQGFSFLFLPMFTAVIMGDPVIRDFRTGVDPLIFSKPVSRAAYLLGKFCGNFFVLVCCQSAFALTLMALQWLPKAGLVVQPARVFPYFKHFLLLVVISHLLLAAIYFTVGTLTRSANIVYAAAVAFYSLYIAYGLLILRALPRRLAVALDPMQLGFQSIPRDKWEDADWVNRIVITYNSDVLANRALMILLAAVCLTILYFRFSIAERTEKEAPSSLLNLSPAVDRIHYDSETFDTTLSNQSETFDSQAKVRLASVPLPEVARTNEGLKANLRKLVAATALELRLLRAEKSLVVIIPLAVLLSFLSLPFSAGISDVSYSASFASHTANGLLLFLLGVIVFYTGEAMHRDREVRVEPVLWSVPAPNNVLLLSKFLSTHLLVLFLLVLVGLTAMLTQLLRSQTPVKIWPYLITYSVILIPSLAFVAAAAIALNVLLRDKYLAYAVSIAIGSGLFYLYSQGYNHWLYNPVLYGLWTEADLTTGKSLSRILPLRVYCLAITLVCLFVAHLRFERRR